MSIIDETRSFLSSQREKLQQERGRLVDEREKLDKQIAEVDDLLDQLGGAGTRSPGPGRGAPQGRRSGIRDRVLQAIQSSPTEMRAAHLRSTLGLTEKPGSQSVSNALSALKKDGKIIQTEAGGYKAA